MFNSTILDVLVGLVFVFLVVSLMASALTEAAASIFKLRSKTLLAGVQALLNDPEGTGIAKDLYNHALISPRDAGAANSTAELKLAPAYIDPAQFANAMIELHGLFGKTPDAMKSAVSGSLLHAQTKQLLIGMIDRSKSDVDRLRDELAAWFDNAMDRVSGAYKRMTQLIGFITALLLCIALNIDAINVAKALWVQPMLARSIDGSKFANAEDAFTKLRNLQLPIGWSAPPQPAPSTTEAAARSVGISVILGWLITALASLFGAPFWYDALQSFVRIKGAGPSPAEKTRGAGAAA
jgi:hypothetical protein